ncbi:hypothetical protein QVD17_31917 [Tagetes erecta]|uniref:Uncharacterized protein n=1 Tax=Tagetes erecta TaxID=13708 RepID=A0AAD8K5C7_TARER|nr:hypothetical protein QVD17_31917 [Tagetes erecta]
MTYLTQYDDKSVLPSLIYPYASSFEAFDENGNHIVNRSEHNNWKCAEMEKKLKKQLNHHHHLGVYCSNFDLMKGDDNG